MDTSILENVDINVAWELVEKFSTMPRWKPEDVNKSADLIIKKLKEYDVDHEVLTPSLYLSIPFEASVKLEDGTTMHAKPPSYSTNCTDGLNAPLHYIRLVCYEPF